MLRKLISPIIFVPLSFFISAQKASFSKPNSNIENVLEEKENTIQINYSEIKNFILENNQELQSLRELVSASTFNLSSKISKKYPSIDLQASGFPKYVAGKNFNSNSQTLKTSQFSADPSITIRLDLIDPLRAPEIKIAKDNYQITKNNYEIKKRDLIQEAKARYHRFQKSYQDIKNKEIALDLSITSMRDAQSKLDSGVGTQFEVLEAEAQLSRDKQSLNDKKIQHKINELSLLEILNINGNFKIQDEQKLSGFWNYKLNKNITSGLSKNLSLKNIALKESIKQSQSNNFLNANKPKIYISNTLASSFSKGDSLAVSINSKESASSYSNTISLNFAWNIFDGGQNKNLSKSTKAEAKSEVYSLNNLKNVLRTNINKAYLNLNLNEDKIISSFKEISATKEALRLSRLRYDVGISTLKDVLVKQNELSNAKSKNIDAIYNYNLILDELERLTYLSINKNCLKKDFDETKNLKSICEVRI